MITALQWPSFPICPSRVAPAFHATPVSWLSVFPHFRRQVTSAFLPSTKAKRQKLSSLGIFTSAYCYLAHKFFRHRHTHCNQAARIFRHRHTRIAQMLGSCYGQQRRLIDVSSEAANISDVDTVAGEHHVPSRWVEGMAAGFTVRRRHAPLHAGDILHR